MGSRLVKRGDGYFISTEPEKNQSQIYLYNYVHYDMLYRYRHAVNISRTEPLPRIQYRGNPDLFSEADRTGTGKILPAAV